MRHKNLFAIWMVVIGLQLACTQKPATYIYNEGFIYGTVYHMTYQSPGNVDLQEEITNELNRLDLSFSTFKPSSIISRINTNQAVVLDTLFINVFNRSQEVWKQTNGAFDPTVMPLVNAWGFGFKHRENVTNEMIDSLLGFVGMEMIWLNDSVALKSDTRVMLDFSAIAKGYAVDVIGLLLAKHGCENYMVEIGGEMLTQGVNPKGKPWRVGINEPNEDEPAAPENFQAILQISGKAIATSGNYRNFYEKDGKKICPYNKPVNRLSCATFAAKRHGCCQRLHDCRCFCNRFYGIGERQCNKFGKQFERDGGIFDLCRRRWSSKNHFDKRFF
jgi:FAD:protein FMN transferase